MEHKSAESTKTDRELVNEIVASAEAAIYLELDAKPWKETLESQGRTFDRIKGRIARSGKKATILDKLSTKNHLEVKTENLGPNEWWLCNTGIAPGQKHAMFYEWDFTWALAKALNHLQQESLIENFDFGEPYKIDRAAAVFVTSPYSTRKKIISKIFDLSKEYRETTATSSPAVRTSRSTL